MGWHALILKFHTMASKPEDMHERCTQCGKNSELGHINLCHSCRPVYASQSNLPREAVAEVLAEHGESCAVDKIGYYPSVQSLAAKTSSSKWWSQGEVFVYAQSDRAFIIMKQIAPSSCEMLTISQSGVNDVLSAHAIGQAELVELLQGYLDTTDVISKDYSGCNQILVLKATGSPLQAGTVVQGHNGSYVIRGGHAPAHLNSSGRVATNRGEFYPSVVGAEWQPVSE